ncbi:alkaline phosphatase family protein [soil metagenome]
MRSITFAVLFVLATVAVAQDVDRLKVGVQADGRIVVPTNQVLSPAGKQVTFQGRPVDLLLINDGKTLVLKNMKSLVFVELATGTITQTLASPVGFSATGLLAIENSIFVTDADDDIRVAMRQATGQYQWAKPLRVKKPKSGFAYPTGLASLGEGQIAVAGSRGNVVQRIDLKTAKVIDEIAVGVAPFGITSLTGKMYVSNWGGDMPKDGDPRAPSTGTDVRVDDITRAANSGSVSVLTKEGTTWKVTKSIIVGLHPSGMALSPNKKLLFVANACSDTVSVIDTVSDVIVETILCRPDHRLPFGSGTNALTISADGGTLYAANGTNNCIAVVRLGKFSSSNANAHAASMLQGLIPTGWFPGGVALTADGKMLCVANVKGHGSVSGQKMTAGEPLASPAAEAAVKVRGRNTHDHLGSASLIPIPDEATLAAYTKTVNENNRLGYSLSGLEMPRPDVKPAVVPARHGEPGIIEHVIYVVKENRTYDQVFGDIKAGNGDPNLVMFGEDVTPNQHSLVQEYTLFDNFYCSGVLSADGHQWCNEAYVTDYLERAFGKFTRSYPYEGNDPLAFAPTGFIWDNALSRKKSFFNFGEFTKTTFPKTNTWSNAYSHYKKSERIPGLEIAAQVATLKPLTKAGYPGFVMSVPDVYRARMFIEQLKEWEKSGTMPNLIYLYLPCDHTSGTRAGAPTPKAMVADNDLALGQCVEAISKSKFWGKTCLLSVEDDPQNGFDHVDSHRTVALAISPYSKRKFVDSTCYNQTGMVKTIELMLGLPPMNQLDLSATPMRACFAETPDLTPYKCRPNKIPLDTMNPPAKSLTGNALKWALKSEALDLSEADLADEDTLNRILWFSVHGDREYPARFVAPKELDGDDDDKPKKK